MSGDEVPELGDGEAMVIACVTITRVLASSGDVLDHVTAADADGEDLGLAEALGMMRLAEDTLIRSRYGDGEDHGDDQ